VTRAEIAAALATVEVGRFVPRVPNDDAVPAAIGFGQHHTPAETVLRLALEAAVGPGVRLLEVGTGSGYAAAVFAACGATVTTIERHPELAQLARERLSQSASVIEGDGLLGWADQAPYDAIVASGSVRHIPPAWLSQLAVGGRLLVAVGAPDARQELVRLERLGPHQLDRRGLGPARFAALS
jgi:protein-L-isoaspartate(D-aspartate) O-methyltransferase